MSIWMILRRPTAPAGDRSTPSAVPMRAPLSRSLARGGRGSREPRVMRGHSTVSEATRPGCCDSKPFKSAVPRLAKCAAAIPAPVQKLNQAGTNLRVRLRFLTGGQDRRSVRHWLKQNVSWPSQSRRARSSAAPNACGGTSRFRLAARKPRGRCRRATSPDYWRPPSKA